MQVACTNCAVANEIDDFPGGEITIVCHACGQPFTISAPASGALLPPRTSHETALEGEASSQGLDSLMDPTDSVLGWGDESSLGADPAFSFGSDVQGPDAFEPSFEGDTFEVADVGVAFDGWRLRTERGVIYDMMDMDAVLSWLSGRPQLQGIQLAQGEGDFRPLADYPEVAARFNLTGGPQVDDAVGLDLDRGRVASSMPPPPPPGVRAPPAGTGSAARPAELGPALGLGFVLVLLLGGTAVVGAGMLIGHLAGASIPAVVRAESEQPATEYPAMKKGMEAFREGRYTSAVVLLRRAAEVQPDDPRPYRYLAIALHRVGRQSEAHTALARYRREMARRP